jgi:IclR family pca regulon transcriptional regulator
MRTSQGRVLLAGMDDETALAVLDEPSRSDVPAGREYGRDEIRALLAKVRERGWAVADEELAPGVRSVAVPVRDAGGTVRAAMNVTVHAAETSMETLLGDHLPLLQEAAALVSEDWVLWQSRPTATIASA